MARKTTQQLAYTALRIEGGLIPAEELTRLTTLAAPEATEQTEVHYDIPKGLKLRDEIARYFKIAQNLWQDFAQQRHRQDANPHSVTEQTLLLPLLRQVLGYADLTAQSSLSASGNSQQSFNIGHAAFGGRLPVVLAGFDHPLDQAAERFGDTNPDTGRTRRRSPYMLAQEALNASDQSLWAITSNGLKLRILRDNPSLTRPAYIEVDLEAIFTEELYADFTAFWLLAHASRFGKIQQDGTHTEATDCPWERWRNAGQKSGETVRMNLRFQVEHALRSLGTGFLSHPANTRLREQLQNQEQSSATKQVFFEELLSLVYRFIFLATVEDRTDPSTGRSLIFTPDATFEQEERYWQGYSLTWLRERSVRRSSHDTHSDLWQALSITFRGLATGQAALGLPALGGLFAQEQCPLLNQSQIDNRHLLAAVFQLGYFRQSTGLTRVNYRDMGAEELGSVYESLLELVPDYQHLSQPHAARLAFVGDDDDASNKGNARKLTGSYYTPDSLVQELIQSALDPVIAHAVQAHPANPVQALLELTVCDPACGSGHFLLAAARRLADEVANLRAAALGGAPTPADYRHALRDVVSRCIYGVDKNPMAIALAKTALWLEAYTPDRPLTFIDHHLQVGDALLGVLDPKILENGIPDAAYAVLSGDDKATAAALKKQNKAELKSWKEVVANDLFAASSLVQDASAVEQLADDTLDGIATKRSAWAHANQQAAQSTLAKLADTYVAAFLAPKVPQNQAHIPMSGYLWGLMHPNLNQPANLELNQAAHDLCRAHSVFHWWQAFPQVAAKGGFAVMLGNPPWERIKLQEEEFFATRSPLVATAKNKAERAKRIELLRQGLLLHTLYPDVEAAEGLSPPNRAEMRLYEDFIAARRGAEAASLYAHDSGRYPLTGVGDVNTYALFAETLLQLTTPQGRAGFIVPTGIATDDTTKIFFGSVVSSGRLAKLISFYEVRKWFPATDERKPFCLLTLGTSGSAKFIFDVNRIAELVLDAKWYELLPEEFRLLNPNTRTLPTFRSKRDAELTKKLYRAAPVLIREAEWSGDGQDARLIAPEVNPWSIRFSTMFHMSNDSHLFTAGPADADLSEAHKRLPLYEAKMIHQFDHRWATYVDNPDNPIEQDIEDVTWAQKVDPAFTVRPRYWVEEYEVLARIARVPGRVANAWLAFKTATEAAQVDDGGDGERAAAMVTCGTSLTLAVAQWVAGALLRQRAEGIVPELVASTADMFAAPNNDVAASHPTAGSSTSLACLSNAATAWALTQKVEAQMAQQHRWLADALKADGSTGKKALSLFQKWARQDDPAQGEGLSQDELAQLQALQGSDSKDFELQWLDAWMDRRSPRWLIGWRDITNAAAERTVLASVFPRYAANHKTPLLFIEAKYSAALNACLLAGINSIPLDYIAKQKVSGSSLTYHYVKQFAVLPPEHYSETDLAFILPRVLELTYTAHDIQAWADDLLAAMPSADPRPPEQHGTPLPPFPWNPERRAQLRAELDAYYARLYGLTRDELRYILDPADVMGADYPSETFRVLKKNEIQEFGEYRTQRLVLAAWDKLSKGLEESTAEEEDVLSPIYSEQGVIKTLDEAEFAGLLLSLVRASELGMSVDQLQDAVVNVALAGRYLNAVDAQRLRGLSSSLPLLSQTSTLDLVQPFVLRLESAQLLQRKRDGGSVVFIAGLGETPADVLVRPSHPELASLMLKLSVHRSATAAQRDEDGGDDPQVRFGG
ncbi:N-6 DNA methylase [Comamonas sp. Y6]|uniref:site-specific DNA-methyltransferase (adenine-specific) n=1 Tax=Comamonas resistens TaxID=3046670 RepID=A0ABY8SLD8_9BURK|nr:N-6 DNA methylase [Comamonas resistens]MDL5039082.1 N-6 DNA methylase [Comamonas resistens]WHS63753.1 N-6 DNA methylase [Comamonas resistens]